MQPLPAAAEGRRTPLDDALAGKPEAYRRLDAGDPRGRCSSRARSDSATTTSPPSAGSATRRAPRTRSRSCAASEYDAAFFLRPTPVEQVRAVAAAGETMPPKSTYFFPKLLTGHRLQPAELRPRRVKVAPWSRSTRSKGDDGTTSLWYGGRVPKHDARTEAYGSIDEACSALGVARALCGQDQAELAADILRLQQRAVRRRRRAGDRARGRRAPRGRGQPRSPRRWSTRWRREIDRYMDQVELPPQFVIPGGTQLSAALDVARTAIRRAERRMVALARRRGARLRDGAPATSTAPPTSPSRWPASPTSRTPRCSRAEGG